MIRIGLITLIPPWRHDMQNGFRITGPLVFPLVIIWTRCLTNNRVADDLN